MEKNQSESEKDQSLDLESPNYSEADKRIRKADGENLDKLNLGELRLIEVPREVLDLIHLRRLHLCRNRLLEIPEELCLRLCQLRWLDLRSNFISRLPSTVHYMKDLRILLLDDNSIRILPFELGLLRKLKGIYVRNNPLEFPNKQIMERGLQDILKYLSQCYQSREDSTSARGSSLYHKPVEENGLSIPGDNNSADLPSPSWPELEGHTKDNCRTTEDSLKSLCKDFDDKLSISTTDESHHSSKTVESPKGNGDSFEARTNLLLNGAADKPVDNKQTQEDPTPSSPQASREQELEEILFYSKLAEAVIETEANVVESKSASSVPSKITRSGTLPWTSSSTRMYRKIKKQYLFGRRNPRRSTSISAFGLFPSQSIRHEFLLPENPPQPTIDMIRAQHNREKKKKARQQAMIAQQATLQKLKNAERIRGWRKDYMQQQKEKLMEYLNKTQQDIREEANQRIIGAPFDVGCDELKMIGTAELNALRERGIRSATPPPNLSAHMVLQLELASLQRDRRLTERVHRHLEEMGGRYQVPLPSTKEALYTEMLTAKRDLDLALRLHHRVKLRMETLEHFRGSNRRDLWS